MSEGLETAPGASLAEDEVATDRGSAVSEDVVGDADPSLPPGGGADAAPIDELDDPTEEEDKRGLHPVVSWVIVLVVAAVCAICLRAFVVQTFFVPSVSMYPTLQVGDRILVQKIGYSIERGDILVFRRPPGDKEDPGDTDLVKRVIGLPGDTIWTADNKVYINGKPLSEPYLPKGTIIYPPVDKQTIPPNDYFMMGDNRSNSLDSRYWGDLPRSYVVGKVFLLVWRHGRPDFHVV
jgi:signal peptidase I